MPCSSTAPRLNVKPHVWGPSAWKFLYMTAMGYPNTPTEEEQTAMKQFILSLKHLLPCEKCRVNFNEKIDGVFGQRLHEAVQCSQNLLGYFYDLESAVAKKNGKEIGDFGQTMKAMTQPNTKSGNGKKHVVVYALIPVVVLLTGLVTWLITSKVLSKKRTVFSSV